MRDRGLTNEGPGPPMRGRGIPRATEVYPYGPVLLTRDRGRHPLVPFNRYTRHDLPTVRLQTPLVPSSCPLLGPLILDTLDSLDRCYGLLLLLIVLLFVLYQLMLFLFL